MPPVNITSIRKYKSTLNCLPHTVECHTTDCRAQQIHVPII